MSTDDSSFPGSSLYIDPRLHDARRPSLIASQPVVRWFGDWTRDVRSEVDALVSAASAQGALAQLVVYNIPGRDSGGHSSGSAGSSEAYRAWIDELASGIGQRSAIVVLEPDALAQLQTLSEDDQARRLAESSYAVSTLDSHTKPRLY